MLLNKSDDYRGLTTDFGSDNIFRSEALSTVCRILHGKPRFYELFEDKCLGGYLKDKLLNNHVCQ